MTRGHYEDLTCDLKANRVASAGETLGETLDLVAET